VGGEEGTGYALCKECEPDWVCGFEVISNNLCLRLEETKKKKRGGRKEKGRYGRI